jgi:plasmid stabilization system protein ParE
MHKPIKWSSKADADFAGVLDYLYFNWNKKISTKFIQKVRFCINLIEKNPKQFALINTDLQIRKCVITKQNSLFYRETATKIEILRIYDTRQNPEKLTF